MNVCATRATAWRVLRQIRRDPRTIALLLVVPAGLLVLLYFIFDGQEVTFQKIGAPLCGLFPFIVMFLITSMPVGGAETLLVNLIRRLDRERFSPLLGCFKSVGPLGQQLVGKIPVFHASTPLGD